MGAKKLNTHEKSEIVLLHELGFNQTKIASRLGKNQCSISKFLKRRAERNSNDRKSGSGRPRLSSKHQDKALERLSLKDRFASGTDLRKQWKRQESKSAPELSGGDFWKWISHPEKRGRLRWRRRRSRQKGFSSQRSTRIGQGRIGRRSSFPTRVGSSFSRMAGDVECGGVVARRTYPSASFKRSSIRKKSWYLAPLVQRARAGWCL